MFNSWRRRKMTQTMKKPTVQTVAGNTKPKHHLPIVSFVASHFNRRKKRLSTNGMSHKTKNAILVIAVFDAMLILLTLDFQSILLTIACFTAGFIIGYLWG